MDETKTFRDYLNPNSLKVMRNAKLEPAMNEFVSGKRYQFVRNGYFCADSKNSETYNRIVTLKGSYKPS
jgi:glutaminyl-tRNA synthetase